MVEGDEEKAGGKQQLLYVRIPRKSPWKVKDR